LSSLPRIAVRDKLQQGSRAASAQWIPAHSAGFILSAAEWTQGRLCAGMTNCIILLSEQ